MSSKVQADAWGYSRGVSRCKYRWRWYNVAGRRRGHKAPTLASIECCRQIHHLLSDRITGARYTARCVELGLGRGPRAGDGGENASDQFAVSCSLSFVVICNINGLTTNTTKLTYFEIKIIKLVFHHQKVECLRKRATLHIFILHISKVEKIVSVRGIWPPLCITSGS